MVSLAWSFAPQATNEMDHDASAAHLESTLTKLLVTTDALLQPPLPHELSDEPTDLRHTSSSPSFVSPQRDPLGGPLDTDDIVTMKERGTCCGGGMTEALLLSKKLPFALLSWDGSLAFKEPQDVVVATRHHGDKTRAQEASKEEKETMEEDEETDEQSRQERFEALCDWLSIPAPPVTLLQSCPIQPSESTTQKGAAARRRLHWLLLHNKYWSKSVVMDGRRQRDLLRGKNGAGACGAASAPAAASPNIGVVDAAITELVGTACFYDVAAVILPNPSVFLVVGAETNHNTSLFECSGDDEVASSASSPLQGYEGTTAGWDAAMTRWIDAVLNGLHGAQCTTQLWVHIPFFDIDSSRLVAHQDPENNMLPGCTSTASPPSSLSLWKQWNALQSAWRSAIQNRSSRMSSRDVGPLRVFLDLRGLQRAWISATNDEVLSTAWLGEDVAAMELTDADIQEWSSHEWRRTMASSFAHSVGAADALTLRLWGATPHDAVPTAVRSDGSSSLSLSNVASCDWIATILLRGTASDGHDPCLVISASSRSPGRSESLLFRNDNTKTALCRAAEMAARTLYHAKGVSASTSSSLRKGSVDHPLWTRLEALHVCADRLQRPLQPYGDPLPSGVYEVFETDRAKYQSYREAMELCLEDFLERSSSSSCSRETGHGSVGRTGEDGLNSKAAPNMQQKKDPVPLPVCVLLVGAGRGPLITEALMAASTGLCTGGNISLTVIALEKNPHAAAFLRLRAACDPQWASLCESFGHLPVQVLEADGRTVFQSPSASGNDSGVLQTLRRALRANAYVCVVSELLGSSGDNEASPECLDDFLLGLRSFLHSLQEEEVEKEEGLSCGEGAEPSEGAGWRTNECKEWNVVCIPTSYVTMGAPLHSTAFVEQLQRLPQDENRPVDGKQKEILRYHSPYVTHISQGRFLGPWLPVWSFEHPSFTVSRLPPTSDEGERKCASSYSSPLDRDARVTFPVTRNGRLDGIALTFDCILYQQQQPFCSREKEAGCGNHRCPAASATQHSRRSVALCTTPTSQWTVGLFSWFPLVLPLQWKRAEHLEKEAVDHISVVNTVRRKQRGASELLLVVGMEVQPGDEVQLDMIRRSIASSLCQSSPTAAVQEEDGCGGCGMFYSWNATVVPSQVGDRAGAVGQEGVATGWHNEGGWAHVVRL